jgi:pyruvate dehydrogenase E1 component
VILQDGMQRMLTEQVDEYYYITLMNENYTHPDMPAGAAEGIIKGMYLLTDAGKPKKGELRVQLLGSGTILRECIAAAELLQKEFGVVADIWSCPSFTELRRDGFDAERWNRLHPEAKTPRIAHVTQLLEGRSGPAIAATDYVRAYADQIRAFVPMRYSVLGTDGFGRSDTRAEPAPLLRGRPPLHRARRHRGVGAGRQDEREGRGARDQGLQDRSGEGEPGGGVSCRASPCPG